MWVRDRASQHGCRQCMEVHADAVLQARGAQRWQTETQDARTHAVKAATTVSTLSTVICRQDASCRAAQKPAVQCGTAPAGSTCQAYCMPWHASTHPPTHTHAQRAQTTDMAVSMLGNGCMPGSISQTARLWQPVPLRYNAQQRTSQNRTHTIAHTHTHKTPPPPSEPSTSQSERCRKQQCCPKHQHEQVPHSRVAQRERHAAAQACVSPADPPAKGAQPAPHGVPHMATAAPLLPAPATATPEAEDSTQRVLLAACWIRQHAKEQSGQEDLLCSSGSCCGCCCCGSR